MSRRFGARTLLTGPVFSASPEHWGRRQFVRSVQLGTITINSGNTTATATITAVDPLTSTVSFCGMTQAQTNSNWAVGVGRIELTNPTTVTASIFSTAADAVFSYVVTQYWPGVLRSVQRGTISWVTAGDATATVTAVVPTSAELTYLGRTMSGGSAPNTDEGAVRLILTNATTVTGTKIAAVTAVVVGFELREFYP